MSYTELYYGLPCIITQDMKVLLHAGAPGQWLYCREEHVLFRGVRGSRTLADAADASEAPAGPACL